MAKIIQLRAENVKRLTAVQINPQGHIVVIGGDNAQGKTSVLDSIAMAFGGGDEIPAKPVRQGAEKGRIVAELDNGLVVRRTFTAAGGTALVIENKEGARYPSPQKLLDELTGKLSFDPLAFTRLDPKKQAAMLSRLVGLDFTEQEAKRAKIYEERSLVNKNVARVEMQVEAMPFHADAPTEEVSTAALVTELDEARKHNAQKAGLVKAVKSAAQDYQDQRDKSASVRREIAELEERLRVLRNETLPAQEEREKLAGAAHDAAIAADFEFKLIDESPIREKLVGAAAANKKFQENLYRADALSALKKHKDHSAALTAAIDVIDKAKDEALAKAPFPVEGLSFTTDGVTFNGIPFEQASAAEQLRVSVAIGAALNPKLRVMLVRDGSLLDDKSMELLAELAAKHDLQVWIERVGKDDECAVIIEDGAVVSESCPDSTITGKPSLDETTKPTVAESFTAE